MEKVAIVILNFNGRNYLEKFLHLVVEYSPGCQVVVADNGSTDGSISYLEKHHPLVKRIILSKNHGFSTGYNLALQQLSAKYFVLLNSDVEVTPHWVEPVISLMEDNCRIAACQPKILSYSEKNLLEYAGAAGGYIDILGYPFCRGRIFSILEEDQEQFNDTRKIFWATGACMFVRGEVYHQLGGLDGDFFAHMEEIDLCWRMQHAGYEIYYQGISSVYHVGGGTLPKSNPHKTYLNFRNGLAMLFKNSRYSELIWKLPCRLFLDHIAALHYLIKGNTGNFFAIFRAQKSFLQNIGRLFVARKGIKFRKKEPIHQMYQGFLVIDYFLLKKKTFNDFYFKNTK